MTTNRQAGTVEIRDVNQADLSVFYEHQLDAESSRMAAFPSRDHRPFMKHWKRILGDEGVLTRTILFDGQVAGNIVSGVYTDKREVGYWLGREYWGKGIATRGLAAFLEIETSRPLYAHVARHNIGSIRVLEKCGFEIVGDSQEISNATGEDVEELLLILTA